MAYLKGNYTLHKEIQDDTPAAEDQVKAFERFARRRLGGSIAFVMKGKSFVWAGEESPQVKPTERS